MHMPQRSLQQNAFAHDRQRSVSRWWH